MLFKIILPDTQHKEIYQFPFLYKDLPLQTVDVGRRTTFVNGATTFLNQPPTTKVLMHQTGVTTAAPLSLHEAELKSCQ